MLEIDKIEELEIGCCYKFITINGTCVDCVVSIEDNIIITRSSIINFFSCRKIVKLI